MKVQELRIGNYVYNGKLHKSRAYTISELRDEVAFFVEDFGIMGEFYKDIKPIFLDELWLEKLGFKNVGLYGNRFEYKDKIDTHLFVIESDGFNLYPQIDFQYCCLTELKYVHQLQNLFFAITGEELILKT